MILIADSGSTKTHWVLMDGIHKVRDLITPGINPVLLTNTELLAELQSAMSALSIGHGEVDSLRFYGAGCLPELCGGVREALMAVTGCSDVEVDSDMIGAARALCGHNAGIVCILGTGSNTCEYDGTRIVANTPPLGYVLGDEGSGARLGIALVNGVLKGYLPEDIRRTFQEETGLDKAGVIEQVYRRNAANVFLASLVPFISRYISVRAIEELVAREFRLFFERNIVHAYSRNLPVHFAGSIASVFETQLRNVAHAAGYNIGRIEARPLDSLVRFHCDSISQTDSKDGNQK